MNFTIIDLSFLALFVISVSIFLYRKRKNLKRSGLLYLYRTKWGIKLIEKTGKKYSKTLKILSYVSVVLGYLLMLVMIYFFIRIIWIYIFHSDIVRAVKIPPIMPLIPYLPQMFKLSFLPPFFFSYWIIVLAIIAITHEFFHGIFAAIAKVKTKKTGFGFFPFFLPIFLAAFVELDEKAMVKKSNFKQRAILSAGTFANILTAILGLFLMWGFFSISFAPAGIVYDDYAYDIVQISSINSVNDINLTSKNLTALTDLATETGINKIKTETGSYYGIKGIVNNELVALYYDAPAIKNNVSGVIASINQEKIYNLETLSLVLSRYSPGEEITLELYDGENYNSKNIILEKNPSNEEPWLGISFLDLGNNGALAKISKLTTSYKEPHVFYLPKWEFAKFIYDLLWWLVFISFSVALVNMLPVGIFDGGRFFYLTILAITKSEKKARKAFKGITNLFLLLLIIVMFFWAKSFF